MSLKIAFALAALAGVIGIGFGYFLRWIISLGKRGSMELEIKQIMLNAEVRAQKVTEEAEGRAREKEGKVTSELKEKERELKTTEDRLVRKEELLDTRQAKLDSGEVTLNEKVEGLKKREAEVEELRQMEQKKLEQVANLSAEDARNELIRSIEKQSESDIESRMRKLEISGNEKLEKKAQEILTTSVHRL